MAYLFDTDALSEALKPRPATRYLRWLSAVARDEQYTSAAVVAELYEGAFRVARPDRILKYIDETLLPAVTVLPFDGDVARVFGWTAALMSRSGRTVADMDLAIAATAIRHDLELVTGNIRHFEGIPRLRLNRIFADARAR